MNLREFAALKAGDKISNAMGNSQGEVVEVTEAGVKVRWGEAAPGRADLTFTYVVNGTSWFHWSKVEAETCERCQERIGDPHKDGCPAS